MQSEPTFRACLERIDPAKLIPVGRTLKPHALAGEVTCELDIDPSELLEDGVPFFLFIELESLPVPFRLLKYRPKGEMALLRFAGVDSSDKAKQIVDCRILIESDYLCEDRETPPSLDLLLHYRVVDQEGEDVGEVMAIDESTINPLFRLQCTGNKQTLLLPAAAELIQKIDHAEKVIHYTIPEGLLDL